MSVDLHPAVLKLQRLDQRAAEAFGASSAVNQVRTDHANTRIRLRRELGELEEWLRWNKNAKREAYRDQLQQRLAYLDAAIRGAGERFEQLNTEARAARSTADALREHLAKTLDAGGFDV